MARSLLPLVLEVQHQGRAARAGHARHETVVRLPLFGAQHGILVVWNPIQKRSSASTTYADLARTIDINASILQACQRGLACGHHYLALRARQLHDECGLA